MKYVALCFVFFRFLNDGPSQTKNRRNFVVAAFNFTFFVYL